MESKIKIGVSRRGVYPEMVVWWRKNYMGLAVTLFWDRPILYKSFWIIGKRITRVWTWLFHATNGYVTHWLNVMWPPTTTCSWAQPMTSRQYRQRNILSSIDLVIYRGIPAYWSRIQIRMKFVAWMKPPCFYQNTLGPPAFCLPSSKSVRIKQLGSNPSGFPWFIGGSDHIQKPCCSSFHSKRRWLDPASCGFFS